MNRRTFLAAAGGAIAVAAMPAGPATAPPMRFFLFNECDYVAAKSLAEATDLINHEIYFNWPDEHSVVELESRIFNGKDFVLSNGEVCDFGDWVDELLAEANGKPCYLGATDF